MAVVAVIAVMLVAAWHHRDDGFHLVFLTVAIDMLQAHLNRNLVLLKPVFQSDLAFLIWVVVKNNGPFLGTLNIRCRSIIGTQKGTIILTTTHVASTSVSNPAAGPSEDSEDFGSDGLKVQFTDTDGDVA